MILDLISKHVLIPRNSTPVGLACMLLTELHFRALVDSKRNMGGVKLGKLHMKSSFVGKKGDLFSTLGYKDGCIYFPYHKMF